MPHISEAKVGEVWLDEDGNECRILAICGEAFLPSCSGFSAIADNWYSFEQVADWTRVEEEKTTYNEDGKPCPKCGSPLHETCEIKGWKYKTKRKIKTNTTHDAGTTS